MKRLILLCLLLATSLAHGQYQPRTSSGGGGVATTDVGTVTDTMLANAVKPAVAVVAVANLTLSGEQTIDGQLTAGSLVLATAQTTGSQNGPWISGAGTWTRPGWYTDGSTTQAPQFLTTFVRLGTVYGGSMWRMTTASVTIGTTSTTWAQTSLSTAANLTAPGALAITGGAGNMTITSGTGNSRTLILQTTTSGGTATNALSLDATQSGTFGGNLTVTGTVGSSPVTVTGQIQTTSQPVLNLAQTWNAGAITFTGIKENITDTASAAGSLLMDLQVAGTSKFAVKKDGSIVGPTGGLSIVSGTVTNAFTTATEFRFRSLVQVAAGTVSAPGFAYEGDPNTGLWNSGADTLDLVAGGASKAQVTTSGLSVGGGQAIVKTLSATATLDFASTSAQTSSELTITLTGATDGDDVIVSPPNGSSNANTCFTARVSATDTVSVKFNNYSSGAVDPTSGTFRVSILRF